MGSNTKLTMSASESSCAPRGEYCRVSRATNPSRKSKRAAASISTKAVRSAPSDGSDTMETTPSAPHSRLASVMILGSVSSFAFWFVLSIMNPVSRKGNKTVPTGTLSRLLICAAPERTSHLSPTNAPHRRLLPRTFAGGKIEGPHLRKIRKKCPFLQTQTITDKERR